MGNWLEWKIHPYGNRWIIYERVKLNLPLWLKNMYSSPTVTILKVRNSLKWYLLHDNSHIRLILRRMWDDSSSCTKFLSWPTIQTPLVFRHKTFCCYQHWNPYWNNTNLQTFQKTNGLLHVHHSPDLAVSSSVILSIIPQKMSVCAGLILPAVDFELRPRLRTQNLIKILQI